VRIWTTERVLTISEIFFQDLPCSDMPFKKRMCSSAVQRPGSFLTVGGGIGYGINEYVNGRWLGRKMRAMRCSRNTRPMYADTPYTLFDTRRPLGIPHYTPACFPLTFFLVPVLLALLALRRRVGEHA